VPDKAKQKTLPGFAGNEGRPESPPCKAASRESRRNAPFCFFGP
jgi:hypothetical protein